MAAVYCMVSARLNQDFNVSRADFDADFFGLDRQDNMTAIADIVYSDTSCIDVFGVNKRYLRAVADTDSHESEKRVKVTVLTR